MIQPRNTRNTRKATRTITIGELITNWYVRRLQWGVPHGFYVHFKGRTHVFAMREFVSWWEVLRAIDRRLEMARLRRVGDVCMEAMENYWKRLRVTVERSYPDGARRAA